MQKTKNAHNLTNFQQNSKYKEFFSPKYNCLPLTYNPKKNTKKYVQSQAFGNVQKNERQQKLKLNSSSQFWIRNNYLSNNSKCFETSGNKIQRHFKSSKESTLIQPCKRHQKQQHQTTGLHKTIFDKQKLKIIQDQLKLLAGKMNNIQNYSSSKEKYYQSKIYDEVIKNNQLQYNIISNLKSKIKQLHQKLTKKCQQNIQLLNLLENTKNLFENSAKQFKQKQQQITISLQQYQRVILQKEQIIKRMSIFNDQLCLKLISYNNKEKQDQKTKEITIKNPQIKEKFHKKQCSEKHTLMQYYKQPELSEINIKKYSHYYEDPQQQIHCSISSQNQFKQQQSLICIVTNLIESMSENINI